MLWLFFKFIEKKIPSKIIIFQDNVHLEITI